MPKFRINGHYETTSSYIAVIEIKAATDVEAFAIADQMDHEGRLPWKEESCETTQETVYYATVLDSPFEPWP